MFSGLDLGSIRSACCSGDGTSVPTVEPWLFPAFGDDYGWMIDTLHEFVTRHIETVRPTALGYEAPIWKPGDKLFKMRRLYALGPHVEWVCRKKGVECVEHDLHDMKATLTGDRNAKKPIMVAQARRLGVELSSGQVAEDEADAFAAWLVLLRDVSPVASRQWDTLIWSKKGNLI